MGGTYLTILALPTATRERYGLFTLSLCPVDLESLTPDDARFLTAHAYIDTITNKYKAKMKTMKLWRIAFMMLAAFSLASCSSDDDNNVYEAAELGGTWQKVYDDGIVDAGMVQYTFHPQSANNGTVDLFTSDWAAGDTTVYRIYTVTDAGHLQISPKPDDTSVALTVDCDIRRLTSTQMIWYNTDSNEELARFKKIK